jgi:RNA polymerase sigma-70 factor (ECF subfamily)
MKTYGALSDESLVARAKEGDEDAFGALVDRHLGLLHARIARALPDHLSRRLSVADILQETRIAAFAGLETFDVSKGAPRGWLLGIARHKALQAVREHDATKKRGAHREVTKGERADTGQFRGRGPSPSEAAVTAERAERVRRALDSLPEDYREVLRLSQEEGLSLGEAAERMGRSREATKKLYGRALMRCRQVFRDLEESGHGG